MRNHSEKLAPAASDVQERLRGLTALVTGATGGLGVAHTTALAAQGARVIAHARTGGSPLESLATQTGATGVVQDLATPEGARALVRAAAEIHGGLDLLVANHATMTMAPLVDADPDDWWRVVDVNLLGTFALIQETVRVMREQRRGGRIIVIVSEWGVTGWPGATAYAASKSGLISLVKCLGHELAPEGIFVNAIAPGVIETPQLQVDADDAGLSLTEMHARYASEIPMRRIGRPDEIAEAVCFLADPSLRAMAGQTLQLNGGATRGRV
ncbi:SDR family NAD(P)-dependent oxidoreductase [Leucobacter sp. USHLN153]|uniref:SDR family NAD(P)-dependent oxidoreductase n=1 Tax=Leucobacter sp. USHLN153 TaxID=3081268 RepID=UPI003017FCEF